MAVTWFPLHIVLLALLPACVEVTAQRGTTAAAYTRAKAALAGEQARYQAAWEADTSTHDSLRRSAADHLLTTLTHELLPAWYGTPWDFNGTSRVPGQGHVACGYFVTTVLQDAGFRIPRVRWAQLASEPVVRKLDPGARSFSGRTAAEVVAHAFLRDEGLYLVGLDNHVGFLLRRGGELHFIHSNYYQPETGVMCEPALGGNPFAHSRYRVVGRLLTPLMVERWITGAAWE